MPPFIVEFLISYISQRECSTIGLRCDPQTLLWERISSCGCGALQVRRRRKQRRFFLRRCVQAAAGPARTALNRFGRRLQRGMKRIPSRHCWGRVLSSYADTADSGSYRDASAYNAVFISVIGDFSRETSYMESSRRARSSISAGACCCFCRCCGECRICRKQDIMYCTDVVEDDKVTLLIMANVKCVLSGSIINPWV